MNENDWSAERRLILDSGATLAPGLSEKEFRAAESAHGFRFPPDLRAFLSGALPVGPQYPNWREPESESVRARMAWPWIGTAFDIENNAFWWKDWGPRPGQLAEALTTAQQCFAQVPKLIPVFGHRYLPAEPDLAGNPVLSVYQTDVIYYGLDLQSYWAQEHGKVRRDAINWSQRRPIRFWSELIEGQGLDAGVW